MRFHISAIILILAGNAVAADPKPTDLSPEEFAAGWLSLFDGESTFGWTVTGKVEITGDTLKIGSQQNAAMTPNLWLGSEWEVELQLRGGHVYLSDELLKIGQKAKEGSQWGTITFRNSAAGSKSAHVSGIDCQSVKLMQPRPELTKTPFVLEGTPEHPMTVRSIKIRPLDHKDLFNGKDLTGWKRFTGNPKQELSKFEVTKEGELHLTNGPGDLQTEKSFKDFCLQLECKTNGDKLNSGIFFRCLTGQYQQGYEAQIHNGFKDNDRTKPTDFGTGAIYRRIPARKVVPNDKEWFTMTVLAVGPRLRTWVNGFPTVDWVDERPANANARSGRKLEAGPISIQGHDPTTDLLFRNIRIVEIEPPAKN